MKSIIKLGLAGLCLLLASKAKADEIYLKLANTQLNPVEYNEKIKDVSVGNVYGSASGMGIGYRNDLSDKVDVGMEISQNSQKVDATKQNIATGEKITYGENSMAIRAAVAEIAYKLPLSKSKKTIAEFCNGFSLSRADLMSSNEIERKSETYILPGIRIGAGIKQEFNFFDVPFFARLKASYNMVPKLEELDISNSEVSLEIGGKF